MRQIVGSFGGFFLFLALAACGPAALVQCRLDAVKVLPEDPGQITPYDLADVVKRLNACKAGGDAGR